MIEMTAAAIAAPSNLDPLHTWGLSVIRAFQAAGNPAITEIAKFFTLIGEPVTYVVITAFVFWCIDERRGAKLGIVTFLSYGINTAIKEKLHVPRPFIQDPSVGMIDVAGFSTPSSHAQLAATFWPTLALDKTLKNEGNRHMPGVLRALGIAGAFALPVLVGLSRVYLGVHYPSDVLFGWALGALIAVLALVVLPRAMGAFMNITQIKTAATSINTYAKANGRSLRSFKLALAAFASLILNAVCKGDSSTGGILFGFAAGYIFLSDSSSKETFSAASGSWAKKTARLLVGLAVLIVIFFGLNLLVAHIGAEWQTLTVFAQYGLTGFWISWGAPKLFVFTGLD